MQHYSDSKRAFVPFDRGLYDDETVIYRYIIPAAFQFNMGSGVVSNDTWKVMAGSAQSLFGMIGFSRRSDAGYP